MDVEAGLICRILRDADLTAVLESKINPSFFEDDLHATVFAWIYDYYAEYQQVPTQRVLRATFKEYRIEAYEEPIAYFIDQVRAQRQYAILHDAGAQLGMALKGRDTTAARQFITDALLQLDTEVTLTEDLDLTNEALLRLVEYRSWRDLPRGLRGLPTGFPSIDYVTLGLQDGQLVTIIGLPKSGKSTMALLIGMAIQDYGAECMFVGFEMSNQEQTSRYDAFRAKIDYRNLMAGQLSVLEEASLERALRAIENKAAFHLVADPTATSTVSLLAAKAEQYKPECIIVDGVYMMECEIPEIPPGTAAAITSITRGLKRLGQRLHRPVVCTTQSLPGKYQHSKGLTIDSIGYTSSFAQDSDLIIGIDHPTDFEDNVNRVKVVAARNAKTLEFAVRWSWETGEFEELEGGFNARPAVDPV